MTRTAILPTLLLTVTLAGSSLLAGCNNNEETQSALEFLRAQGFTTLATAIDAADLEGALDGSSLLTVFAPTNAAFEALPPGTLDSLLANPTALRSVLRYHIVGSNLNATQVLSNSSLVTLNGERINVSQAGGNAFINASRISQTNVAADFGTIHVLNQVLLPPAGDIVQTAAADNRFDTLVTAVTAAGLVDTLKGTGPFTVFAPTDDAFAALPAGTLDSLLADIPALTGVLTYHVVPSRVFSHQLTNGLTAGTVQGANVTFGLTSGAKVNGVNIVITDIVCSNGVIHVIDAVLLPPS